MFNKKIAACLLSILIILSFSKLALASDFEVDAKSAVLVDAETGQVLTKQNPDIELPPASITKIMTLLLAMEELEAGEISLDDEVYISEDAEAQYGSQIWVEQGDKISLDEILRAVIIPSANDATVALAEHIGGTKSNFVRMMNQRAEELAMEDTYFANSTGLPERESQDTYTTAYDIATMAAELAQYDFILDVGSKRVDMIAGANRFTTNNLLGHYPGADGLKTGWTTEAGYCLVGTAQQDDSRLIAVVMGTESDGERVRETEKLLNYGFRAFHREDLINEGVEVAEVEIDKGVEEKVGVLTENSFAASIRRGTKDLVEQEITLADNLEAPVEAGDIVGEVEFIYDGNKLGSTNLLVAEDVERAGFFTLVFRWIRNFITGFFN